MLHNNSKSAVWDILPCEGKTYLKSILEFILDEFCRIFGEDIMYNEECTIFNDPAAKYPMLIINRTPIAIRLAQPSLLYWAQTIYQLSHEICHYVIRQHKNKKDFTLSWFEEPICEAVSLYFLDYCATNWKNCELYNLNPSFSQEIRNYLCDELNKNGTDNMKNCDTCAKLSEYNKNISNDRIGHVNERNRVFYAIMQQPLECPVFCEYQRYINPNNGITICFDKWQQDNPSQIIKVLHSIQPIVLLS